MTEENWYFWRNALAPPLFLTSFGTTTWQNESPRISVFASNALEALNSGPHSYKSQYFTLQLPTHKAKRLKYVIFRGSLLGAHRRGHPLLPRVPHPSPHHCQPAVGGTPTSRGGVRDWGLDDHLHHLHLPRPALLHHPPPVVSGAAKLVKRLWSQVTCKRHHTQMPIADNSVLLWSHPPQEPPPPTTTTTITTTAVKKEWQKMAHQCFSPLITVIYRMSCTSTSSK